MSERRSVNVHEAKTHLSRLLDAVDGGAEIVIARSGKPVARLVPFERIRAARKPGYLKGRIRIAEDFDAPLAADVVALFERVR